MKIGDRLKISRKEIGMTQKEAEEQTKINRSTISNYESNKRMPNLENVIELANLYNVSIDWLTGRGTKKQHTFKD